jgi:threonine/homoserine/homoserine lactone efflux protein
VNAEFLLTSLVIAATPGTGVLFTLSAGLSRGAQNSVVAALGCTLGIVPHMAAAITGVAALLHTSAVAYGVLKYAGVAYLLYMAWTTLRAKDALVVDAATARSTRKTITSAILVNLLNPKLTVFFFAFLPQFVSADDHRGHLRMLALSAVFMAITFVVFTCYGVCAAAVREQVISRPRVLTWLRRIFAGSFVALSARLAFARQ